ncbi:PTS system, nitrogen regulatory IIA component [Alkalispirochaeta americana]|uniref:PTS system, nitrogen regulatory IIA component n=1 Tax=Alkalispirochaeta americana TaxID=159291 RepID=A0A1N6TF74_9SPIO|nr:PTS sugar transporter subunit IIA [Alkalispirochaeta americana]SIQ52042.1 PTS system, nitrogen regulatory IIA component [Alkalispirochaeta americana]
MLFDVLNESLVKTRYGADSLEEVVEELLRLLDATGKILDLDQARRDLRENQQHLAAGMQHGIAIPHAKTAAVQELVAAVVVTEKPIDCQSVDGSPSQIFIMTLSPHDMTGPHIRFLSEIGRLLKHRKVRRDLLKTKDSRELLTVLRGA